MPRTIALLILFIAPSVIGFGGEVPETAGFFPDVSSIPHDDTAESMEGRHDLNYLDETFDGPDFPPAGWATQTTHPYGYYEWEQNNSNYAGGTAPEAWVEHAYWASGQDYFTALYTPTLDTSDARALALQFKHHCLLGWAPAGHEVYVSATSDGSNWIDVTPWSNPAWLYYYDIGPETVTINLKDFIGPATRVAFWILVPGSANNIEYWAVDDVRIYDPGGPIDCDYTVTPLVGTVPFSTTHRITLSNVSVGDEAWTRRVAGRIAVTLGNGSYFNPFRAGFTNIQASSSYITQFPVNIPALASVIGENTFVLTAEDVTPAPYNEPPYPPSGWTCTSTNVVVANTP
jgi:hypothetical protein